VVKLGELNHKIPSDRYLKRYEFDDRASLCNISFSEKSETVTPALTQTAQPQYPPADPVTNTVPSALGGIGISNSAM
jgi:hypothetical protein